MCLVTTDPTIKIATEDITVYKYIRFISKKIERKGIMRIFGKKTVPCFLSLYMGYEYELNVRQRYVNLSPILDVGKGRFELYQGYHSYVTNVNDGDANSVFIIPKGTEYIEGFFNDDISYISSTIIFKGKI